MNGRELVLITGSSGYIGSAIAKELSEQYQIIGLDRDLPREKIPGVFYRTLDITSRTDVTKTLLEIRSKFGNTIHSVIHLVSYYSFSGEEDSRYDSITVEGTRSLMRTLRENFSVEQFIFSSSMLVYRPVRIGEKIIDDSPIGISWPYPNSKIKAEQVLREEQGNMRVVNLRMAGVYDDFCHQPTLANHIVRIHECWLTSFAFPGNPHCGQSMIHLHDLANVASKLIEKRNELPLFETFVLGEEEIMTFKMIHQETGRFLHKRPWPLIRVPNTLAKFGAVVMEKLPIIRTPFIKPWMINHAEDHYDVDITRLKDFLDWEPEKNLRTHLPLILNNLLENPEKWYAINKIELPFYRPLKMIKSEAEKTQIFASIGCFFLGILVIANPFGFGGLERGEFISELVLGTFISICSVITLFPTLRWVRWINAAFGFFLMFSPLAFNTGSEAAYLGDTLLGALVLVISAYTPPTPEENEELGIPPGWTYNPSTAGQRFPIMFLALLGFLFSRYLASYQLGHIDNAWDPFFGAGTEKILTSDVSKAFPVSDAGLGAFTYLLDLVTACIGGRARWRSLPWAVILFGFMIIPAGVTSIVLVMLQPIAVGAWCTVCLITAFIMLWMVPPAVDEVIASIQFLRRRTKAGESFWKVFWLGSDTEEISEIKPVEKEGNLVPLLISSLIGIWLMFAPYVLGIEGIASSNIYIVASLITTFSIISMSEVARIVRLLNVPLGIWLVLSAAFMEMSTGAKWHSVIVGIIVTALSLPRGKRSHAFGSVDRFVHWSPFDWFHHTSG